MLNNKKRVISLILLGSLILLLSNFNPNLLTNEQIIVNPKNEVRSSAVTVLWSVDVTPKNSGSEYYCFGSPALGDIDSDGKLEVLIASEDEDASVRAINGEDGSTLWSYASPNMLSLMMEDSTCTLGDVDNDGKLEVIVGSLHQDRMLFALDAENGNFLWAHNDHSYADNSAPVVADIDEDGNLEVIVGNYWDTFFAVNGEDGTTLWSFDMGGVIETNSPAIGDIDADGDLEVIVGSYNGKIYALNGADGNEEWSYQTNGAIGTSVLGDVDKDGKLEIITTAGSSICAFNGEDGSLEWNCTVGDWSTSTPALADIDGDNRLEVVVGYRNNKIYALNGEDGSLKWNFTTVGSVRSSPAIGDVDNDGKLEIVVGIYGTTGKLYAINGEDGTISWSYDTGDRIWSSPVLADLDSDGSLEVITVRWDGLMIALNPSPSGKRVEWEGNSGDAVFNRWKNQRAIDTDQDMLIYYSELKYGTNTTDPDSDDDGLLDGWEVTHGFNPLVSDSGGDGDGDGLTNLEEQTSHTDPNDADSDDDGLLDGEEVLTYFTDPNDADSEDDGMPDGWEVTYGLNPNADDSDGDPDVDELLNIYEYGNYTNPNDNDTEDDGMPDGWEVVYGLDPTSDDSNSDPDIDGLLNIYEYGNFTYPNDNDTENDGMPDGWEVLNSLDPLSDDSAEDPDNDMLTNLDEYTIGSNPNNYDPIPQLINIVSPTASYLCGKTPIDFVVELTDFYLDSFWYTIEGSTINVSFTFNGTISQSLWNSFGSGDFNLIFYANDIFGRISSDTVMITKDIDAPTVSILNPSLGDTFYVLPPQFEFTVIDPHLQSMWYTLDGGLTNTTITSNSGSIGQSIWEAIPLGEVTIQFYANDSLGNMGFAELVITKATIAPNQPDQGIPGYNIYILISVFSISSIIITLKRNKKFK